MSSQGQSRRAFLIQSLGGVSAAWVAANYDGILGAEAFVQQAAQSGRPMAFAFFTPEQAVELEASRADHPHRRRQALVKRT